MRGLVEGLAIARPFNNAILQVIIFKIGYKIGNARYICVTNQIDTQAEWNYNCAIKRGGTR